MAYRREPIIEKTAACDNTLTPSTGVKTQVFTAVRLEKCLCGLEVVSILVILIGSLLLFALLGGCAELRSADVDLGLKTKITAGKSSSASPSDKPVVGE